MAEITKITERTSGNKTYENPVSNKSIIILNLCEYMCAVCNGILLIFL